MANILLFFSCLLYVMIRPAFSAPTLIDTTPSIEDWTTIDLTEATLRNDTEFLNKVHDGRADDIKDNANLNQSDITEFGSQTSQEGASTESANTQSENFASTKTISNTASFDAIGDDVSLSTFSTLQSRAEISASEEPQNGTFFSNVESNDADNISRADVANEQSRHLNESDLSNVTISDQSRNLEETDFLNATINLNETARSDTSSEGNSSNSGQKRVIFVLPGPVNFSSHAIVNGEDTLQTSSEFQEPLETEFNESAITSVNSTETLLFNASDIGVTDVAIDGREDPSMTLTPTTEEDVTQEQTIPRIFNESDIEEVQSSVNDTKNSSLIDAVELALSNGPNISDSAFVNDLADLVSSISAMNGTELAEPETTANASQPDSTTTSDGSIADFSGNSTTDQTRSSSPSTESPTDITNSALEPKKSPEGQNQDNATSIDLIDANNSTELNEIFSSSLEDKSSVGPENRGNETSIELVSTLPSNSNDSTALNEIGDANGLFSQDFVTNEITATSRSNLNGVELVTESPAEIDADPISTPALDSGPSAETVAATTETENDVSSEPATELSDSADELLNSTTDENLMQRNAFSTEPTLINEGEKLTPIVPTVSSDETVESTTVSGNELFANTPLEYFINSTTISTLDITTVASIVGSQGSPPNTLLELYNRHVPKTSCNHLGREYATGQHVEQLDPCHFCVCVNGYLDCYWKNCPPAPEGCLDLAFDGVCDRSLYLCPIPKKGEPLPFPANTISRFRRDANYTQMSCDILGVQYRVGELIGVASDPCMECRCAVDSLYCSPKCCFQPVESGQDPSKNSRANDAVWQPVLSHPLKHLRYDFENQFRV